MKFEIDSLSDPDLFGKNIAAMTESAQAELGVSKGDYVKTEHFDVLNQIFRVATLTADETADTDARIIQIGRQSREIIQRSIGAEISVHPVDADPAEEATLWVEENPDISGDVTTLYQSVLEGRGVYPSNISVVQLGTFQSEIFYSNVFVDDVTPDGDAYIAESTALTIEERADFHDDVLQATEERTFAASPEDFSVDDFAHADVDASYEDIGGLSEEIDRLEESVGLPLRFPEVFTTLGISPPQGILLYGPPGTGKTLLARAVASEAEATFMSVSGPEAAGSHPISTADKLQTIFEEAREAAPAILFIDEIDAIARDREGFITQEVREGVTQLLTLMDGLEDRGDVVVIAATNRPEDLDDALRRGGRFTRELEIGIPNADERHDILKIHTRGISLAPDVDLADFAAVTHGYVGADLETLVKEAGLAAIRRVAPRIDFEADAVDAAVLHDLTIRKADLKEGLAETSPSGMRDVAIESPDVAWDDVGGQDAAKHELRKAIEWPLDHRAGYEHLDLETTTGILLHGPPGTGKTLLAKAVASETDANFLSLKGSELISKWVGESARNVGALFEKARRNAPAVLFIDEIDAVLPRREGLRTGEAGQERSQSVSQFLTELDGLEALEDVVVVGTTNRLDAIDPAVLRDGRLDVHVEVGPPDEAGRAAILAIHTREKPLADAVDLEVLAERTEGYTGAELERLCTLAAEEVLEETMAEYGTDRFGGVITEVEIRACHFERARRTLEGEEDGRDAAARQAAADESLPAFRDDADD